MWRPPGRAHVPGHDCSSHTRGPEATTRRSCASCLYRLRTSPPNVLLDGREVAPPSDISGTRSVLSDGLFSPALIGAGGFARDHTSCWESPPRAPQRRSGLTCRSMAAGRHLTGPTAVTVSRLFTIGTPGISMDASMSELRSTSSASRRCSAPATSCFHAGASIMAVARGLHGAARGRRRRTAILTWHPIRACWPPLMWKPDGIIFARALFNHREVQQSASSGVDVIRKLRRLDRFESD